MAFIDTQREALIDMTAAVHATFPHNTGGILAAAFEQKRSSVSPQEAVSPNTFPVVAQSSRVAELPQPRTLCIHGGGILPVSMPLSPDLKNPLENPSSWHASAAAPCTRRC